MPELQNCGGHGSGFPFGASPPELKQWLAAIAAAVAAKAALGNSRNQFLAVAGRLHLEHNTGSV